jgi:hypothetical protein
MRTYRRSDFPAVPPGIFQSIDDAGNDGDTAIIRIRRTVTYEGPREWVKRTLSKSLSEGENRMSNDKTIHVETLQEEAVPA